MTILLIHIFHMGSFLCILLGLSLIFHISLSYNIENKIKHLWKNLISDSPDIINQDMIKLMLEKYKVYTLSYMDASILCQLHYFYPSLRGYYVEVEFITTDDYGKYMIKQISLELNPCLFEDLAIQPVSDSFELEKYKIRGDRYVQLTHAPSHFHGTGNFYYSDKDGSIRKLNLDDRVIIDPVGSRNNMGRYSSKRELNSLDLQSMLQFAPPTVSVYSFKHRLWGEVHIDSLEEISFDVTAYDRIYLKDSTTIRNVVSNFATTSIPNFMNTKRKGLVFLFSGNPGTGKSLTVAALAELVQKPFYKVSIADLGNNAHQMDQKLEKILSDAEKWQAIVLIDEIDIFTHRKDEMILSVFLRLIENFNGILFLTSNHPHAIDPALLNRIHLHVKFPDLGKEDRIKMWHSYFNRYDLNVPVDINYLSEFKLSNRQIDNLIQVAYISVGGKISDLTTDVFRQLLY